MTDLFTRVSVLKHGYRPSQVDAFFSQARAAYERPAVDEQVMSAFDVRRAAFDMVRKGYDVPEVDVALDRLEQAFLARVREQFQRQHGQQAWMHLLAQRAQVLYPRLRRPLGQRFANPGLLKGGYDAKEVDALLQRIIDFFDQGVVVTAQELRDARFRRRIGRGAYDERTVDAFLARAADILMGVQ